MAISAAASIGSLVALMASVTGATAQEADATSQAAAAKLGQEIFLDASLSNPPGMSCVSCHFPEAAFADPRAVSPGAVLGRNGRRNAPSLMYAALIPNRDQEDILEESGEQVWVWQGGMFQDGSARTLHEQVQRPFFDHAEMNLLNEADLAGRLRNSSYAPKLKKGLAEEEWTDDGKVTQRAYRALVEFLKEPMFRPFDARIDDYLAGNKDALSAQERRGLEIFKTKAKCADCHLLHNSAWPQPLLSDYGYDNLGVPSRGESDPGLGGHTGVTTELGQFRSPSLRNVALTAPYMHNGSLATLREVIEFYNKRDLEPERWGKTDYPETVNHSDLGNLGLDDQELSDLVALMDAFTDRSLLEMRKRGDRFPQIPLGVPDSWKMRAYFPDWNHAATPLPAHPPQAGNNTAATPEPSNNP
ncbi:cytochrome-c peroxidase [Luteolibacter luteus]|uniref:Cytochrome c domain-containing protein n=1 Tax=Luteolibacter luteus TaxID=2728835 RepID=A0A858REU9_9BACT|nr:cytochrome c peroxidase [Luteolibacter luteus]QJE95255.1 hypothetical protein HHL09_05515 [Luteolibacter luteus]